MNQTTDLDRILTEWLDEGPKRAPDHPVQMAIQHAMSHPRRPDPVWFMRADVMAPRAVQVAFQPIFALLAVGAILAAVVAVGVGSRGNPIVVPPSASVPPTAAVSPEPSVPVATPSPTPPTIKFNEEISIIDSEGQPIRVTVHELSGVLDSLEQGDLTIGTDPDDDGVWAANAPGDDTLVHVVWVGCPDQDEYLVTADPIARTIVVETSECSGDTFAATRAVALQFSEAVDAASLELTLREQNAGDPSDG
jgi:hypothetical protein